MVKVALDAGHALTTAGKQTPDGVKEWTFNNKVLLAFQDEISKYQNVQILRVDDPTGKRDVPLKERTDKANKWGADYFFSFHHNAFKGVWGNHTGAETFIHTQPYSKTIELQKAIHPAVIKAYGLKDRGMKRENFHVLRETNCSAILIEGGFMDSLIDIKKLRDNKVLDNAGREIAKAFAKFAGLKLKPQPKPEPKPEPKPQPKKEVFYRVVTGSFKDRKNAEARVAALKKVGFDSFIDIYEK